MSSWDSRLQETLDTVIGGVEAVTTTDYVEYNIKRGRQHYVQAFTQSIGVGEQKYYYIKVGSNDNIIVKTRDVTTNSDNIFYRVYYNAEVSDTGTTVPIYNFNGITPRVSEVIFNEDPIITTLGDFSIQKWLPGSAEGKRSDGEYHVDGIQRFVPKDTIAILELDNQGSSSTSAELFLTWYEGPINGIDV